MASKGKLSLVFGVIAIVSLILLFLFPLSINIMLGLILSILAILFGIRGMKHPIDKKDKDHAKIGVALGIIVLIIIFFIFLYIITHTGIS